MSSSAITYPPLRRAFQTAIVLLASSLCVACGCSKQSASPTVTIEGMVTVAGQPVPKGKILFFPNGQGNGSPASATIEAGRYKTESAPVGKSTVMFRAIQPTGKMVADGRHTPAPDFKNLIPEKYRNGVEIDVRENGSRNFEL